MIASNFGFDAPTNYFKIHKVRPWPTWPKMSDKGLFWTKNIILFQTLTFIFSLSHINTQENEKNLNLKSENIYFKLCAGMIATWFAGNDTNIAYALSGAVDEYFLLFSKKNRICIPFLPVSVEIFVVCGFLEIVSSRTKGRTKPGFLRTSF